MHRNPGHFPGATRIAGWCADAGVDAEAFAGVADVPLEHAKLILDGSLAMPMWAALHNAAPIVAALSIGGVDVDADAVCACALMDRTVRCSAGDDVKHADGDR